MKMKLKKYLHRHEWQRVYTIFHGTLEECECGEQRTTLWDYTKSRPFILPGNVLRFFYEGPMFIVCGSYKEYQQAANSLMKNNPRMNESLITWLDDPNKIRGIRHPYIILYGEWWTQEEVISDPHVTNALNGWNI